MEHSSGDYTSEELCCTVFYMARYAEAMEIDGTITVPDEQELFWLLLDWARKFETNFDPTITDHQTKLESEGPRWLRETFPYEPEVEEENSWEMGMSAL